MPSHDPRKWNINVDKVINHFVPPPPFKHFPYPVARFFGYRKEAPVPLGNVLCVFWAFIGIFCAISIVEVTGQHIPSFAEHGAPLIVGSFGATAVLEFYSIESPLAQPRNAFVGQVSASIIGVSFAKLFLMSPDFEKYRWVAGALACATATSFMGLTSTIHPPAGATSILAVTDDRMVGLGWFLVPVVMLGCTLMITVALIVNNIQRRFPVYWWTADDLREWPRPWHKKTPEEEKAGPPMEQQVEEGRETAWMRSESDTQVGDMVIVRAGEMSVPDGIQLTPEERAVLQRISQRL